MAEDIREEVRQKYAQAITIKHSCGCCSGGGNAVPGVAGGLYGPDEVAGLPPDAVNASFGCGNPTALAELHGGEIVLDLGSGAGLDVLLSARRVGPSGKAYGLDMTDEMLAEAKTNQARAGIANAEFLKGHIEDVPLPDNVVDVIISNCVINLSADKDRVLKEACRVLKPGGRLAISDTVLIRPLPENIQENLRAWTSCIAGALLEQEYRDKLAAAGFVNINIECTGQYDFTDVITRQYFLNLSESELEQINGSVISAFIRANKPS